MYVNEIQRTINGWGQPSQTTQQSFRYHDEAIRLAQSKFASSPSAEFVLVTFEAFGRNPTVTAFGSSTLANEAYNDVIDAPGARVYAAIIDRSGGVWNEWFGATTQVFESWFTKEKLKTLAPWILGGAAIIAGAIIYARRKRSDRTPRSVHWAYQR
jgi:hypothetical protein